MATTYVGPGLHAVLEAAGLEDGAAIAIPEYLHPYAEELSRSEIDAFESALGLFEESIRWGRDNLQIYSFVSGWLDGYHWLHLARDNEELGEELLNRTAQTSFEDMDGAVSYLPTLYGLLEHLPAEAPSRITSDYHRRTLRWREQLAQVCVGLAASPSTEISQLGPRLHDASAMYVLTSKSFTDVLEGVITKLESFVPSEDAPTHH